MRLRAVTVFARLLVAVAAVAVVAGLGVGWAVSSAFTDGVATLPGDTLSGLTDRPAEEPGDPLTILLIGSDERTGEDAGSGITGRRADTIMVLRVAADDSRIDVVSIPRDSWVPLPGHGAAKANASLAYGGVPMTAGLVEGLTGWRLDHVVLVDFTAVREITTHLGGVTVQNPVETTDPRTGTTFAQGRITIAGEDALTWVRQRHGLDRGDLDRIDRQQQLLQAVVDELLTPDTLADPTKLRLVLAALGSHVTLDADLTGPRLPRTAARIADVPADQRHFHTAKTDGSARSADGQEYLVLDEQDLLALCADITAGKEPA
ncbi:LCP family protein [Actinokineospora sp. PR83]|uniref:LCP family protein n=1 Tax=Actinokineospora sp. PR83 TaxID=2884908 RepID=UPI001F1FEBF2|nr:LCP family protein [Actinokineospora sp. PR83]MCG8915105.1 LCP family protein [Actinokineospora sp. PR83]